MEWLNGKLPVPEILCLEKENGNNYLIMSKIEGEMACTEKVIENSKLLVKILAKGLRRLWKIDISHCPYNNGIDNKLRIAEVYVKNNFCSIENAEPETYGEEGFDNPGELLQWLKDNKPIDKFVFSHGDYCIPNILVEDEQISGFIDLGRSATF